MSNSSSSIGEKIENLFARRALFPISPEEDEPSNPAALPPSSLAFLRQLCRELNPTAAFEFGSGKSTSTFLSEGLKLTSIEDSTFWMQQTCANLPDDEIARLDAKVLPLQLTWSGRVPMMAWNLPPDLQTSLRHASLVLIDSPLYTGFREAVLSRVLAEPGARLVVLDDVRIPSIRRFCDRISKQNPWLFYHVVEVGHRFALFGKTEDQPLINETSLSEIIKGWRRFLRYPSFQRHQNAADLAHRER
jgi:hypothetical protein